MTGVLDGRAVLVTGPSSGIGAALASAAVAAGGRDVVEYTRHVDPA